MGKINTSCTSSKTSSYPSTEPEYALGPNTKNNKKDTACVCERRWHGAITYALEPKYKKTKKKLCVCIHVCVLEDFKINIHCILNFTILLKIAKSAIRIPINNSKCPEHNFLQCVKKFPTLLRACFIDEIHNSCLWNL